MMTVAMVSDSHAGMKINCMFLEKSEGPQVRMANPTMMIVRSVRRRVEDFLDAASCGVP